MEAHEFRLHPNGINVIQKYISTDPIALRRWPACIYSFVRNASSRKTLRDEYKTGTYAEVIIETLEEWIGEQDSNATFGELIQILRDQELNYLCDMLSENLEAIKNAQLMCKSVIENGDILNFWFGMKDVPSFVGRVEELETLHKLVTENRAEEHSSVALLTSLHGFGGIGKTTLARMYAWKYRNYFDGNVVWIDAEKFGSMRSTFQNVAVKLKLKTAKNTNLDLKDLLEFGYNAFGNSKCLFVFDNAETFNGQDGVEQFLPSGIILKPYLLLTSRRKDCFETNRVLPLDVLSQSDSVKLIKKFIPGATDEIADNLAMKLERLPLAIQQAVAYVKKSIPWYCLSVEAYVTKEINAFLEEYKSNSNSILMSKFSGRDGYAYNICSICEMSLRKIELEEGGKLAKQMLTYISFLNPDDIQLDFLLNLDYEFESVQDNLLRIKPLSASTAMHANMMVDLLHSYSLININITEMTIKVHRLVQDAMRLMLGQEEEYICVNRLIHCLKKLENSKSVTHWTSIQRSCRFGASKKYVRIKIPESIELLQHVLSLGLNNDLSKELVNVLCKHDGHDQMCIGLATIILGSMKCNNMNEFAANYLTIYNQIEYVFGRKQWPKSLLLTNYVVFANFVVPEEQKDILESAVECITIFRLRRFNSGLLIELLGKRFLLENVQIFLGIVKRNCIDIMFSEWYYLEYEQDYPCLFDPPFQIPESLLKEFPCLNYLKWSSSFTNIDELQALNLSWDWRNSGIWSLLNILEFNLEAIRSAIAYIYFTNCTIAEYIQNYKTIFEAEQEYRQPEILVQFINANYFIRVPSEQYNELALICCLRSEFDRQQILYIFTVNDCSLCIFPLLKLDDFGIVTRKGKDIYYMERYVQVALRKRVLPFESKTWAVKALHKACVRSSEARDEQVSKELVKDFLHLLEQEDLKQIAENENLSLSNL